MKNKKDILVLGGTGAMGVFLVDILSKSNDWNIFVTTRKKREDNILNVKYIVGNARNTKFISEICNKHYDAIVDFMNYGLEEFENNYKILLDSTDHYLFLSSSRVYANEPVLNEDSSRLLDTTNDEDFKKTQRYALRKAREENILKKSKKTNYTIIRPYITYSNMRMQLGIYEKEEWLYRILNNKKLVIRKDLLDKYTTMTYGYDVALCIYKVLNSKKLFGDVINPVTNETIKWIDVLNIYLDVLKARLNKDVEIYQSNDLFSIEELYEGGYNTKYDRLWNRKFDNSKVEKTLGKIEFKKIEDGLKKCLNEFIENWQKNGNDVFSTINEEYEKQMDIMSKNCYEKVKTK